MRAALRAVGLILLSYASAATACGHCVEDKVAAVYDYTIATAAFKQKHQVAFFGIDGPLVVNDDTRRDIASIARDIRGLDKDSMRVSLESAALSVAFDPARISFAALQSALERKLASKKLSLLPMRVMDEPAKLKTVSK